MIPIDTKPGTKVFHAEITGIEEVTFLGATNFWVCFTKNDSFCSGAKREDVFLERKDALARAISKAYENLANAAKWLEKLTNEHKDSEVVG